MQCWKLFLNKFAQTPLPGSLENSHTETHTLTLSLVTNKAGGYPKMDLKMYKLQGRASRPPLSH